MVIPRYSTFFVYDQCFGKLFLFQCEIEMDECKQRLKLNWHYSKWNSDQIIQYKSVWTKINIHTPCDADIFHKPFTQTNKSNKFKLFFFWIFSAMQQNKKPNANIILFIGVIMAFIGAEMIKDGQRRRKKAN